jgi:hypothetical protein
MSLMKTLSLLMAAAITLSAPTLAHAKTGVTFLIVGDTLTSPFSFTNTSDAGEEIVGFGFDLSTLTDANYLFDTEGAGSTPLTPVNNSAALTGLVAVPYIPDNAKAFSLAFTDFNPGEAFAYRIDVDINAGGSIGGQRLIGAKVYFDFSDGTRSEGFLRAVEGRPNASTFVTDRIVQNPVPEPATWALMIVGFGGAGAMLRRRKTALGLA